MPIGLQTHNLPQPNHRGLALPLLRSRGSETVFAAGSNLVLIELVDFEVETVGRQMGRGVGRHLRPCLVGRAG